MRKNGGVAGTRRHNGGYVVTIDGYPHSVKYVVWHLFNNCLELGQDVGFVDGDCYNCNISNLYLSEKLVFDEKYGKHLSDYFQYDEGSPSGIRWKKIYARGSNVKVGDVAGSLDTKDGYWRVHALGTYFKAHKIVWALLSTASQSGMQIDHLDGDRGNNKIENLRLVVQEVNQRNRSRNKNNTTNCNGVSYSERVQPSGVFSKYTARYTNENGIPVTKTFSVQKYGKDVAFNLACKWRTRMVAELNAIGAGYTDRHGKEL